MIPLRDVACLRIGEVIEMRPEVCAQTQILFNDTAKFHGTVGLDTDRVAVQITRKLHSPEPSHAKPDGRKVS